MEKTTVFLYIFLILSLQPKKNVGFVIVLFTVDFGHRYGCTVCQRNSDPFYIVTYYKKWVTTYWTHSTIHYSSKAMEKERSKIAPPPSLNHAEYIINIGHNLIDAQ